MDETRITALSTPPLSQLKSKCATKPLKDLNGKEGAECETIMHVEFVAVSNGLVCWHEPNNFEKQKTKRIYFAFFPGRDKKTQDSEND